MTTAARKLAELESKIESIGAELRFWCEASEEKGTWEKHYSQIRRVVRPIETAASKLTAELQKAANGGTVLESARRLEDLVIDLHSVWEFYRAKLILRATDPFRHHLTMADELAWACYRPALERIDPLRKEPPLAFFNSATSPYMVPRDQSYRSFVDASRLKNEDALALLKALPIPVIGIPWFQSSHLPDLLIVAHEVGHHVEELGLKSDVEKAVAGAAVDPTHAAGWNAWRGEVFADVYATLALGPGFTTALADFLATAPATITTEVRTAAKWGLYPTSTLRMLISTAALRPQFKAEADEIEQTWKAAFPTHAMTDWEKECATIANAIINHGYQQGAFRLSDLVQFDDVNQDHAVAAKTNALDGAAISSTDVRELVAAAALAFAESPDAFDRKVGDFSPQERIARQIVASRAAGTRAGAGQQADGPTVVAQTQALDEDLGEMLFSMLREADEAATMPA